MECCLKGKYSAGVMVRHRPLVIDNKIMMPAYDEKTMSTVLYKISNDERHWTEYSRIDGKYIQGDLIGMNEKECQIYLRSAEENRKVMKAVSSCAGKTWNVVLETKLHCPLSGVAAIVLSSGNILVSNNNTEEHKRNPISLSISNTKGVNFDLGTWDIDDANIELSYPTLLEDSEGMIHLAYTYNRKMIKHIVTTEEEILEKMSK
jgi:predicted neuraminidase